MRLNLVQFNSPYPASPDKIHSFLFVLFAKRILPVQHITPLQKIRREGIPALPNITGSTIPATTSLAKNAREASSRLIGNVLNYIGWGTRNPGGIHQKGQFNVPIQNECLPCLQKKQISGIIRYPRCDYPPGSRT